MIYILCLFLVLGIVNLLESNANFERTVTDSKDLWSLWRSEVNENKIIILGDSHTQLGLDLRTLKSEFEKEVVQLSIDGTEPWWLFKNNFSKFKKSILIIACNQSALNNYNDNGGKEYQEYYDQKFNVDKKINTAVWAWLQSKLIVFNEFLSFRSLLDRTANNESWYLVTEITRERSANYQILDREKIRKKKHDSLTKAYSNIKIISKEERLARLRDLNEKLNAIANNGCKIILLNTPLDGIYDLKEKDYFPRKDWWDVIGDDNSSIIKIHYDDDKVLKMIKPAEFSHLDKKDKIKYTKRVSEIIKNAI